MLLLQVPAEKYSGDTDPITVNLSPILFNVSGAASICSITPSSDISLSDSQNGFIYQLKNNNGDTDINTPVQSNGGAISLPTGHPTSTTTIYVLLPIRLLHVRSG